MDPPEFVFFPGLDFGGHDLAYVGNHLSVEELTRIAKTMPYCIAFNTFGFMKHQKQEGGYDLNANTIFPPNGGVYIKREIIQEKEASARSLTIHAVCFNNAFLLPFFVHFYKTRFPDVNIVVHDNESTDDSCKIAYALGCTVISTGSSPRDKNQLMALRNTAWQADGIDSQWVLVIDMDEFCDISPKQLVSFEKAKWYQVKGTGYNMICRPEDTCSSPLTLAYGARDMQYDKPVLFYRPAVSRVTFAHDDRGLCVCSTQFKDCSEPTTFYPSGFTLYRYNEPGLEAGRTRGEYDALCTAATCVANIDALWHLPLPPPHYTEDWSMFTRNQLLQLGDGCPAAITVAGSLVEVGCFEGRSTNALAAAFASRPIICIDPWKDGTYMESVSTELTGSILPCFIGQHQRFLNNTLSIRHRLQIMCGYSTDKIPLLADNSVAFALIDGDHTSAVVFSDAELLWPKLVSGGVMLFDDYAWHLEWPAETTPKKGIDDWLRLHAADICIEHVGWQVRIRKL